MSLNVELLEQSFAAIRPQGERLADNFYRRLFTDFPQVRPLFRHVSMPDQKRKLLASLQLVVENLRRPEALVHALEALGARHVYYGTREEHFPAVGQTLLRSLAEIAGPLWNPEYELAWAEAYGEISRIMLAAAFMPAPAGLQAD